MEIIGGIIIGLGASFLIQFIISRTRLREKFQFKKQIIKLQNELLLKEEKNKELDKNCWALSDEIEQKQLLINNLKIQIATYETQKISLKQNIIDIEEQMQQTIDAIYEKNYNQMSYNLEKSAEQLSKKYQETEEEYQNEYLSLLEDLSSSLGLELKEKKEQLDSAKTILKEYELKVAAAVAASKRAAKMIEQNDFYRIIIEESDINEIKKLREIIPYLKDPEALNKVIWKIYYEKPTTDLIGRVIGNERKTGIYKITNTIDNKCYVGQAVDVGSRWKQHVKRGLGADAPTRNKLYPAMMKYNIENFTFELVEECDDSLLDEREDYWQEYFHAKDFGYSIK